MSLLKVSRNRINFNGNDYIEHGHNFRDCLDTYIETGDKYDFYAILLAYCNYSYLYLQEIASKVGLEEVTDRNKTMSYMNSYIAEISTELEIPYFDRETGKSIIDEILVEMIDNNGNTTYEKVCEIMETYLTRVNSSEDLNDGTSEG